MDILLLIVYVCMLIVDVYLLVRATKPFSRGRFFWVYLSELVSVIVALLIMRVAEQAPGCGIMPGLSYIEEVLYSLCAAAVFSIVFLVSIVINLFASHKNAKE